MPPPLQPPFGAPKAPPTSKGRPLKVLYLFSGVAHQLDMATCLQQLAATWTLDLRTECVDIKRNAKLDLSLPKVRNSYLDRIRAKEFDAVLLSPPCASFSRATWANFRGPRPLRSYELPLAHEGLRPASMWQWPQLADLLKKGLRTVAFH